MKKIFLTLALTAICFAVFAQTSSDHRTINPDTQRLELAKAGKALTPEQNLKWMDVMKIYMPQIREKQLAGDVEETAKLRSVMEKELSAILTDDQRKKLLELKQQQNRPGRVE
jgi:hypothetical protein